MFSAPTNFSRATVIIYTIVLMWRQQLIGRTARVDPWGWKGQNITFRFVVLHYQVRDGRAKQRASVHGGGYNRGQVAAVSNKWIIEVKRVPGGWNFPASIDRCSRFNRGRITVPRKERGLTEKLTYCRSNHRWKCCSIGSRLDIGWILMKRVLELFHHFVVGLTVYVLSLLVGDIVNLFERW